MDKKCHKNHNITSKNPDIHKLVGFEFNTLEILCLFHEA
jgi:hypothetical protein